MIRNIYLRISLWLIAICIIIVSLLFSEKLTRRLKVEQQQKMEIWAEAMRQFAQAEGDNFDFAWRIIEDNDNIPVLIVDANEQFVTARNFKVPENNVEDFYAEQYQRLRDKHEPIEIKIDDSESQFIYYDDSNTLKQLQIFPYFQLSIIAIFLIVVVCALANAKKSEQNRVWVGLSKETAHQLGTPISSLVAWNEILRAKYPDDTMVNEMNNDVERLKTIAERFSKIGSKPEFTSVCLNDVVQNSVNYMQRRASQKVKFTFESRAVIEKAISAPLFEWVIENLCKNALDAMDGKGAIMVTIYNNERGNAVIDIADTGKGIEKRQFKTVFRPGYTTKQRGWGLGLPLAKRIIEEYHKGKIFVAQSEIGKGTTFRIIL